MFSQDRDAMRRFFIEAWRKASAGAALDPLETQIARVVEGHPEYHHMLQQPKTALSREFQPGDGETNPFLHFGLHLAVLEQVSTDRPPGIRALYRRLVVFLGDAHEAEHEIMDCLGQNLWEAQRTGEPPNEDAYFRCVGRLVERSGRRR
jgi:hypothetical protein